MTPTLTAWPLHTCMCTCPHTKQLNGKKEKAKAPWTSVFHGFKDNQQSLREAGEASLMPLCYLTPTQSPPPNNKTLSLGTRSYVKAKATHVIGNSLVINQNLGEHPAFLIASELAYPSQGFDTEQDKYLRVAIIPHKLKCRVKRQQKKKNSWPQPSLLQASISPHSPHLKTSLLIDHWFLHSLSWPKF